MTGLDMSIIDEAYQYGVQKGREFSMKHVPLVVGGKFLSIPKKIYFSFLDDLYDVMKNSAESKLEELLNDETIMPFYKRDVTTLFDWRYYQIRNEKEQQYYEQSLSMLN